MPPSLPEAMLRPASRTPRTEDRFDSNRPRRKIMASKIGQYSVSNGQLIKTESENRGRLGGTATFELAHYADDSACFQHLTWSPVRQPEI